ncbi:uncharacterized protein si:ch1073-126c3.2 [Triplophysa rosa]|uniref:Sushi domain-containing protein n=1 Tax=Triplophysa rosa TaxID=992332 RepID=A0A9W7WNM1_TRIRA|nr:uncharacterized protein si:ch1073-126c3.2 [Triplophysa rosa]KAI7805494.1 hypothetical protein IRJ41_009555 [Triplophysa rosa]
MKATTMSKTWKQLFLVFAFLFTESQGQGKSSCSSADFSFDQLHKQLQNTKDCLEATSEKWTTHQNADFFNQLLTLTEIIQKQQNTELLRLLPANCSVPVVPRDGGLLCVSAENNIYCKPMCNAGYDFNLIRRSRLYEKCGAASQHKWTTQYIGGNRLADCTKSHITVAGAPSAFFPEGKDCHKTKSNEQLIRNITNIFRSELIKVFRFKGLTSFNSTCLICGQNQK